MLTELIYPLAHYNLWANERIIKQLQTLSEEQLQREIVSSFSSVVKTVAHVHGAEDVWRQRLHKIQPAHFYKLSDDANAQDELNKWMNATKGLANTILFYDEEQLGETIHYFNIKGEAFGAFRWQMIQHAINHSSYHRGQLVTMMRQLGMTEIPSTDLINYYRSLKEVVK